MGRQKDDRGNQTAIDALVEDLLDEALDLEADDLAIPEALRKEYEARRITTLGNKVYYRHLLELQAEMIKLQDWVIATNAKILVICE